MRCSGVVALLVTATLLAAACAVQLKVASWNIQDFGPSKKGKPDVMEEIVNVMSKFDVVAIQEVKDVELQLPGELLNLLNQKSPNDPYSYILSDRVPKDPQVKAKDQYAVYYRDSKVVVLGDEMYPDPSNKFKFDPFIVQFNVKKTSKTFAMVVIHVSTTKTGLPGGRHVSYETFQEIKNLDEVYDHVVNKGITDVMIVGDLNAGCDYVKVESDEWKLSSPTRIRIRQNTFTWLIGDKANTNVCINKDCPYDRIVVAGPELPGWVQPYPNKMDDSAGVYFFDGSGKVEPCTVSDHYPVEVTLDLPASRKRPFGV